MKIVMAVITSTAKTTRNAHLRIDLIFISLGINSLGCIGLALPLLSVNTLEQEPNRK